MKTPNEGGSYVRHKNGTLKKVSGTEPAPDRNDGPKKTDKRKPDEAETDIAKSDEAETDIVKTDEENSNAD